LTIDEVHTDFIPKEPNANINKKEENEEKWSLDISNIQICQHRHYMNKYFKNLYYDWDEQFILVGLSRIDVSEDMNPTKQDDTNAKGDYEKGELNKQPFAIRHDNIKEFKPKNGDCNININKRGTAIYRFKLRDEIVVVGEDDAKSKRKNENYVLDEVTPVICHYSNSVSGICRFVEDHEDSDESDSSENKVDERTQLKRFIILNYHGIYNFEFNEYFDSFKLNEKFNYPKSIETELKGSDCMDKIFRCLYDQYFLVEQYKNDVQILEGKYMIIYFYQFFIYNLFMGIFNEFIFYSL
jgi:hypothetical protein